MLLHFPDRLNFLRGPFRSKFRDARCVALVHKHAISDAQMYPILRSLQRVSIFEDASPFLDYLSNDRHQHEVIFIQSIWHTQVAELAPLIDRIRAYQERAKIVFLDWYAPIHIPQPQILDMVDLYVKKQVLQDRRRYAGMYNTNLIEYESQWMRDLSARARTYN